MSESLTSSQAGVSALSPSTTLGEVWPQLFTTFSCCPLSLPKPVSKFLFFAIVILLFFFLFLLFILLYIQKIFVFCYLFLAIVITENYRYSWFSQVNKFTVKSFSAFHSSHLSITSTLMKNSLIILNTCE